MLESGVRKNKSGGVSFGCFARTKSTIREHSVKDCNLKEVSTPVKKVIDPLTEFLRYGARDLLGMR